MAPQGMHQGMQQGMMMPPGMPPMGGFPPGGGRGMGGMGMPMPPMGAPMAPIAQQSLQRSQTLTVEMSLPDGTAGLIIGRGGRTINRIRQQSGANVNISKKGHGMSGSDRMVTIQGTGQQISMAQQMITDEIAQKQVDDQGQE